MATVVGLGLADALIICGAETHVAESTTWSGVTTVMTPPKLHWQIEVVSTHGTPPMLADADGGAQGDPVAGTHG